MHVLYCTVLYCTVLYCIQDENLLSVSTLWSQVNLSSYKNINFSRTAIINPLTLGRYFVVINLKTSLPIHIKIESGEQ